MQKNNKLRINSKHLAHYTLSWIAYINNYYNIHKTLKARNHKYLVKIYWILSEAKYRNADYIHR